MLEGLLEPNGMTSFADILTEEDAEAIHGYLISVQRDRYADRTNN